jgi:hypothetical protein
VSELALHDQRLLAYRGRRRSLKALRAATALRPYGDVRAARRLSATERSSTG